MLVLAGLTLRVGLGRAGVDIIDVVSGLVGRLWREKAGGMVVSVVRQSRQKEPKTVLCKGDFG